MKLNLLVALLMIAFTAHAQTPAKTAESTAKQRAKRDSEDKAAKQDVLLIAGLQSTYDLPFEPCFVGGNYKECVRIANTGLLDVQYAKDKKQLIFTPAKKGETTITIRDESGDIKLILNAMISESNLVRRLQELKDLLKDIEGVELKIVADKIVIDGEVIVINDLNRLYAVISDSAYKDIVMNLVTVSPVGMQVLAGKIQAEINNPAVKVRLMNNFFLLEGQVEDDASKKLAVEIAKNMVQGFALPTFALQGPNTPIDVKRAAVSPQTGPIIDRISVAPPKPGAPEKMVRVTIDFVELAKDYMRNFGFSWIPSLDTGGSISFGQSTTGGVTSQGNGSLSGTISNLFPKLSTAQNAGYARILEESVMIVKQNEKARFDRMVEYPYETTTVTNGVAARVVEKTSIGPTIEIVPKVSQENIEVLIDFAYKGMAGKTEKFIISQNHNYKTTVVVKSGESAAIVNAISNASSTAFNKDPPGGAPASPLFTLLRSKAFQKSKSQFVVFLTPQLIESTSTGTDDIKQRYGLKRKPAATE